MVTFGVFGCCNLKNIFKNIILWSENNASFFHLEEIHLIGKSPLSTGEKELTRGLKTKNELSLENPHLNISTHELLGVL